MFSNTISNLQPSVGASDRETRIIMDVHGNAVELGRTKINQGYFGYG